MKHKNLYLSLVIVVAVVAGGGWYLQHVVTEKVGNQVLAALSNTSVQNEISGLANSPLLGNTTGLGAGNNGAQTGSHGQASRSGNAVASSSTSRQDAGIGGNDGSNAASQGSGQGSSQGVGGGSATSSSGQVASNGPGGQEAANSSSTSPSAQATSRNQGGQEAVQTGQGNGSASGVPNFTSRQQLIRFAMSRFTKAQIAHYIQLYAERASLTEQQKAQIKQQILSHFTPAQIKAMAAAAKRFP